MQRMSRWWFLVAIILTTESVAGADTGGTKVPRDVSILNNEPGLPSLWIASGALGSARYDVPTPPAVAKEIGCRLQPSISGAFATCWAYVPTGPQTNLQCSSKEAHLVEIVGALNGDSMITFAAFLTDDNPWDVPAGTCATIVVENASKYFPKTP